MNPSKCDLDLYVRFLCAAQKAHSCCELSRVAPSSMAHDAVNRMLQREEFSSEAVWSEAKDLVDASSGFLVVDDTVLDKPHAKKIDLVRWQYSGAHHDVVKGIGLITLLWTNGEKHVPVDFRVYDPDADSKTKNDHFRDMLGTALLRGFTPAYVMFDCWYSSLQNLKHLREKKLAWICQLQANRHVDYKERLDSKDIPAGGLEVHLKGYGFIKVFRTVSPKGDVKHWATSHLAMTAEELEGHRKTRWKIETYHRGLKQHCGANRCQLRSRTAQKNHLTASILTFLRLEITRIKKALSWAEQKLQITRNAITHYLTTPPPTTTPSA